MPNLPFSRVLFVCVVSLLFLSCQKERSNDKDISTSSPPKPEVFKGYKVDPNAKALGMDYWKNLTISAELYVGAKRILAIEMMLYCQLVIPFMI
jgi:hypothetical protein